MGKMRPVQPSGERTTQSRRSAAARVVVVDDDAAIRLALEAILETSSKFDWIGSCANGREALVLVPSLNPELVLMDINLPDLSGVECTRRLKAQVPRLKVVAITGLTDWEWIDKCKHAGGDGYLTKPFSPEQCVAAISFALSGSSPISGNPLPSNLAVRSFSRLPVRLTDREIEVMRGFAEGHLYKEIADRLHVSFAVIHKLQHRIFEKLRVANRTEAVNRWRELTLRDQ